MPVGVHRGFDPGRLMADVDDGANRLERAAEALHDSTLRWEQAEEEYEAQMAQSRLQADFRHEDEHGKLPSQDRRQDMAISDMRHQHPAIYLEYFSAKSQHEALQVRYRALAAAVSARQSLLRHLGGTGA